MDREEFLKGVTAEKEAKAKELKDIQDKIAGVLKDSFDSIHADALTFDAIDDDLKKAAEADYDGVRYIFLPLGIICRETYEDCFKTKFIVKTEQVKHKGIPELETFFKSKRLEYWEDYLSLYRSVVEASTVCKDIFTRYATFYPEFATYTLGDNTLATLTLGIIDKAVYDEKKAKYQVRLHVVDFSDLLG